jgi:hypothetical protein
MAGALGVVLDVPPARVGRHPKDVLGQVLVAVLHHLVAHARVAHVIVVLGVCRPQAELLVALGERVRDVLEKHQPEDDVLVLGGVHVAAHLVGGGPQRFLETEGGSVECQLCHGGSGGSMMSKGG